MSGTNSASISWDWLTLLNEGPARGEGDFSSSVGVWRRIAACTAARIVPIAVLAENNARRLVAHRRTDGGA
jgi:hypothetical protein